MVKNPNRQPVPNNVYNAIREPVYDPCTADGPGGGDCDCPRCKEHKQGLVELQQRLEEQAAQDRAAIEEEAKRRRGRAFRR